MMPFFAKFGLTLAMIGIMVMLVGCGFGIFGIEPLAECIAASGVGIFITGCFSLMVQFIITIWEA